MGDGTKIERDGDFTTSDIITFNVLDDGSITTNENEQPTSNDIKEIFLDIQYDFLAFQTQWKITNNDDSELKYISPFNSVFFPGLVTYRMTLSKGSYLFEIENAATDWYINRYRQSRYVKIYERDTSTKEENILLQLSENFGEYAGYTFELN